ncbi:MAG: radical SAM protein [Bacillota bacterium]|nr:radical SAM protein [Bacillota bacterium]
MSTLEFAGRLAGRLGVNLVVGYFCRHPERNLTRLVGMLKRLAPGDRDRQFIDNLMARVLHDPQARQRLAELVRNPRFLERWICNWVLETLFLGNRKRLRQGRRLGVHIPQFMLIDPTEACNLRCAGCWAGEYEARTMPPELLDRILNEGKRFGMHWIVMSGGEPFAYKHILDVFRRHRDICFMVYTNGTLIDDRVADVLAELGNVSPAFSLEGWRETTDARRGPGVFDRVTAAMDRLRQRGVLFGASLTATRHNVEELFSDEFIDFLIDRGVVYCWSFHYVPVGRDPDPALMITPQQREWLARRVPEIRARKPILLADFWNDGHLTGGCIAGGRYYFHITAAGEVEPCAFAHFAVDNIAHKSLLEVLRSPIFQAYQERQPFNDTHWAPCPIIDAPAALRDIVAESGARPTHPGAESILRGALARELDERAAEWLARARRMEAERAGSRPVEAKGVGAGSVEAEGAGARSVEAEGPALPLAGD